MSDVVVPPAGATPTIPLTPETRQAYEDLYKKAELAVQATSDGTILGSLNDTKDAIGAVLSADNEARLAQDDASFKAVQTAIDAASDAMKKLAGDIAGVASKIKVFGDVASGINTVFSLLAL
jgi:fumarate hydratase class II